MEFQELANIWKSTDDQIENSVAINKKLIKEVSVNKIKSNLYEIRWNAIIEIVVNFFWMIFLVQFIIAQISDFRFVVPALILLAFAIFSTVLDGYKLNLYSKVNARQPVLKSQADLERLRYMELLGINSLYVVIPLFSVPFLIVAAKAFFNIDIYLSDIFGQALAYYTAGSVLVAVILVFAMKKFSNKKLKESIAFLNELKEAEKSN